MSTRVLVVDPQGEYAALASCQQVGNCDLCGLCETVCSNNIPIRQRLQEVHSLLA